MSGEFVPRGEFNFEPLIEDIPYFDASSNRDQVRLIQTLMSSYSSRYRVAVLGNKDSLTPALQTSYRDVIAFNINPLNRKPNLDERFLSLFDTLYPHQFSDAFNVAIDFDTLIKRFPQSFDKVIILNAGQESFSLRMVKVGLALLKNLSNTSEPRVIMAPHFSIADAEIEKVGRGLLHDPSKPRLDKYSLTVKELIEKYRVIPESFAIYDANREERQKLSIAVVRPNSVKFFDN